MDEIVSIISMFDERLALRFYLRFNSLYKYQHAITLIEQKMTPIKRAVLTPQLIAAKGVKNAFMIYPTSGRMKTRPAKVPIQEEARFP